MPRIPSEVEPTPFYGTSDNDIIFQTGGTFDYYGLGGDDVFYVDANDAIGPAGYYTYPDQYFFGGSGSDTISYVLSDKGIIANLGSGIAHRMLDGQVQSTHHLSSIENLTGSNFADTIYGSDGANLLRGGGSGDILYGFDGDDHLWGDIGNDTVDGGDGDDTVDGGTGNDALSGGDGADTVIGGDGADSLEGGAQNDVLNGGAHNDTMLGDSGDDRLEGGSGNDTMDGGSGTDTVVYTGAGAVTVSLFTGTASGAWGSDTLIGIERVETGNGNDIVYGTTGSNRVDVGGGNDVVFAFDGHDVVYAGSGNDTVYGYEGIDLVYGGTGDDILWGGSEGDTLHGENGADRLNGEEGGDSLFGEAGADWIRGGDGLDLISGGFDADVIKWGAGDSGADTITGFDVAEDRLWFDTGYFAVEPVGAVDLVDVLMVFDAGADAVLAANTAAEGWTVIATLQNVDAQTIGQMITDESILASPVVNFGGQPGDLNL